MEEATKELKTAKAKLEAAEEKLVTAQTEYDKEEIPSKKITDIYNLAQQVVTRCSNAVDSLRVLFVSLKKDVQNLSAAAAAPGKFER